MAVSKKRQNLVEHQKELDVKKWLESESVGYDLCGDFEFCVKCDKQLDNPCAAAYDAFYNPPTPKAAAKKKPAPAKPAKEKKEPSPSIAIKPMVFGSDFGRGTSTRNKSRSNPTEEIAATTTTRKKSK